MGGGGGAAFTFIGYPLLESCNSESSLSRHDVAFSVSPDAIRQ